MVSRTKKRASLHTLGCRLNQSETLLIKQRLKADGYEIVPFGEPADLGIINTCTVTNLADSKCRQSIRQFTRQNPDAYTAVIGCYSQMGSKEIAAIEGQGCQERCLVQTDDGTSGTSIRSEYADHVFVRTERR